MRFGLTKLLTLFISEYRQDVEDVLAKAFLKDNYFDSSVSHQRGHCISFFLTRTQEESVDPDAMKNKEEINIDESSESDSVNADNARVAKALKQSITEGTGAASNIVGSDTATGVTTEPVVTVMDPLPLDPSSSSEESSESENEDLHNDENDPSMTFEESIKVEGLGLVKYYKGFCLDTCQHKLDFQNLSFKPWEVP